jgi:hypothetical protein
MNMPLWKKTTLIGFLIAFFSIQFFLTIFGGFFWPFTSHRLFASQQSKMQKSIVRAAVTDEKGVTQYVHPGQVIPIEYSRCSGLVRNIFEKGTINQKEALHHYLLNRIVTQPWWAFDEMLHAVESSSQIVSLKFEIHEIDFNKYAYPNFPPSINSKELFP